MTSESVPTPRPQLQLPNPPARIPRWGAGESRLRAQQAAERAHATGALDAPGVEATTGDLPYESVREEQAAVESATVRLERLEADAVGTTLLEDAKQGGQVPPIPAARTNSVAGVADELATAEEALATAVERHDRATRVIDGGERASDGTARAGSPIAPEADETRGIRSALWRATAAGMLPVLIPLVVEGLAVTFNMHTYLRADDGNWIQPAVIAVITVGILSIAPYLLGVVLNDQAAGKTLSRWDAIGAAVVAVFWIGVGVTLSLVRVQVDRNEAIRAAQEDRRQAISEAQQLGQSTDIPPVDPGAVFDPVLPTVFWILVFVGFGAVLMLWERTHRNPARLHELRTRLARVRATERAHILREHKGALDGSVTAQERINELALQMWDAELDVVWTSAALDTAEYHRSLGEAAGDPDMPLAVERHKQARAARRAADDSAGGAR